MATVIQYIKSMYGKAQNVTFMHADEEIGIMHILKDLESDVKVLVGQENIQNLNFVIYVNEKNNLIKISKKENKARTSGHNLDEVHEILEFDINSIPIRHAIDSTDLVISSSKKPTVLSNYFEYNPQQNSNAELEETKEEVEDEEEEDLPVFGRPAPKKPVGRKKVAVKDGISQQAFIMKNMKAKPITENPNQTFFTLDEIKKHRKADDCWTVYEGKVYDITTYIRSHPGGKKIMAGAGKDCTQIFNEYHHWVN